jgi:hypothetical protein
MRAGTAQNRTSDAVPVRPFGELLAEEPDPKPDPKPDPPKPDRTYTAGGGTPVDVDEPVGF